MVVSLQQRKFNDAVERKLRERGVRSVCSQSRECVECGAFYVPTAETAEGLCEWCVEALAASS
jgi:uncharacterized protein CbrC (UPF0167 family)